MRLEGGEQKQKDVIRLVAELANKTRSRWIKTDNHHIGKWQKLFSNSKPWLFFIFLLENAQCEPPQLNSCKLTGGIDRRWIPCTCSRPIVCVSTRFLLLDWFVRIHCIFKVIHIDFGSSTVLGGESSKDNARASLQNRKKLAFQHAVVASDSAPSLLWLQSRC